MGEKPALWVLGREVERVPSSAALEKNQDRASDDVITGL